MSAHRLLTVAAIITWGLPLAACTPPVAFPDDGGVWSAAPVPDWAAALRIAVTNNLDDTVSFVSTDLPEPRVLGTIPVGNIPVELEGPHHVAASADGAFLYVGISNFVPGSGSGPHGAHGLGTIPGNLVKLRASDLVPVGQTNVDRSPGDVILSRDGRTAFVSHFDLLRFTDQQARALPAESGFSAVAVVDTATMARPPLYPVCPTAHGMALSEDERTVYTSCTLTDELAILDLDDKAVRRVRVGPAQSTPGNPLYSPYAVARAPGDGAVWISCKGQLRVYDPKADRMDEARTVAFTGTPYFGAFLPDGNTFVVPSQGDDQLVIVDSTTGKVSRTIPLGVPENQPACRNAHAAVLSQDGRTAWVVCEGDRITKPGSLVAVDLGDLSAPAVTGFVKLGMYPDGAAIVQPSE